MVTLFALFGETLITTNWNAPALRLAALSRTAAPRGALLLNFPCVAGKKEFREIALTAFGDDLGNLRIHDVLVAREIVPGAEDADRSGETGTVFHVREQEGIGGPGVMRVVDHEILFRDPIAKLYDFDVAVGAAADALVAVHAEDEGFAVFELENVFTARIFFGERFPSAVIEDVAVLQNLDEGGTAMRRGVTQCVFQ